MLGLHLRFYNFSIYKSLAKQIITQVRISQKSTGTFTWLFVEANLSVSLLFLAVFNECRNHTDSRGIENSSRNHNLLFPVDSITFSHWDQYAGSVTLVPRAGKIIYKISRIILKINFSDTSFWSSDLSAWDLPLQRFSLSFVPITDYISTFQNRPSLDQVTQKFLTQNSWRLPLIHVQSVSTWLWSRGRGKILV